MFTVEQAQIAAISTVNFFKSENKGGTPTL